MALQFGGFLCSLKYLCGEGVCGRCRVCGFLYVLKGPFLWGNRETEAAGLFVCGGGGIVVVCIYARALIMVGSLEVYD